MSAFQHLVNRVLADRPDPSAMKRWAGSLSLLLLISSFSFLWRLGDRGVDSEAEAALVREAFGAGPRPEVPPLHAWCMNAAASATGGASLEAMRLPGALAAVALTLLLFALGRRTLGDRAALLSGVVFATSVGAIVSARVAGPDVLIALGVFVSAVALYEAALAPVWWGIAALSTAATFLAGGVAAALLPLGGHLIHAAVRREGEERLAVGAIASLGACAAIATIAVPFATGGTTGLWPTSLPGDLAGRVAEGGAQAAWAILLSLAPWVMFLPGVVAGLLRAPDSRREPSVFLLSAASAVVVGGAWGRWPAARLAVVALPFLASAVALFWDRTSEVEDPRRVRFSVGLPFVLFLLALPTAGFLFIMRGREALPGCPSAAPGAGVFLILVGNALIVLLFRRQTFLRIAALGATSMVTLGFAMTSVMPRIEDCGGERRFYAEVGERVSAQEALRTLRQPSGAAYMRRGDLGDLAQVDDAASLLAGPECAYCVMDFDDLLALQERGMSGLRVVHQGRVKGRTLALVSNR